MFQTTIYPLHLEVIEQLAEVEVRTEYSGRGMYGRPCFGIVTDDPVSTVIQMTRALLEEFGLDDPEAGDLLDALSEGACQDSMELQSIVYWPHIRVEV